MQARVHSWARWVAALGLALWAAPVRADPTGQVAPASEELGDDNDDDQPAAPADDLPLPGNVEALLDALKQAPNEQVRLDIELTLTPVTADKKPVAPSQEPSRAEVAAAEAKPERPAGKPGKPGKPRAARPYTKVVKDAATQVGYHEKVGNCTKYGAWYGHGMRCVDWCDIFVSWVYGEAGQLDAIGGKHSFVPAHYDWFRKHKRFHARGKKPCRGCIVFFDLNHNRGLDHIGIVTSYSDHYIYTVEGNRTNQVKRVKYERSSPDIFGYGYPKWKRARTNA